MMSVKQSVERELAEETKALRETFASTTLSITNLTQPDLASNPGAKVGSQQLTAWAMACPI
jgi:hypothetical protein